MDIHFIFDLLEIPHELRSAPPDLSPAESQDRFNQLKQVAKQNYRQLCHKYHPDKGGDPKIMKELNSAWEEFQKIRIAPPLLSRRGMVVISFASFRSDHSTG